VPRISLVQNITVKIAIGHVKDPSPTNGAFIAGKIVTYCDLFLFDFLQLRG
jgi:hypothetical protein